MTREHTGTRPIRRTLLTVLLLMAAVFAAQASTALGIIQTQVWTGQAGGPTPDLGRTDVDPVFEPDGSPATLVRRAGTFNITLDGAPRIVYCIDTGVGFDQGAPHQVDVVPADLDTVNRRAQLYVLLTQSPGGAVTPAKNVLASDAQVAIWVLDGDLRETAPTSDPATNARVATLIATARAYASQSAPLTIALGTAPSGQTTSAVSVTGRPGAQVQLSVTSGTGTLSASQVTLGPDGKGTVSLTSAGAGNVSVSATTSGDGRMFRVLPMNGSQATTYALPTTVSAATTVSFTSATPGTPTTSPAVVTQQARVNVSITKTVQRIARPLRPLRYRIAVTNRTKRAALGVVITDRIPDGMSFVRSSRSSTLRGGQVIVPIGRLAAGDTKAVDVYLRANASVRGPRINRATVSGDNVRTVSVRARTIFLGLARQEQIPVTG